MSDSVSLTLHQLILGAGRGSDYIPILQTGKPTPRRRGSHISSDHMRVCSALCTCQLRPPPRPSEANITSRFVDHGGMKAGEVRTNTLSLGNFLSGKDHLGSTVMGFLVAGF